MVIHYHVAIFYSICKGFCKCCYTTLIIHVAFLQLFIILLQYSCGIVITLYVFIACENTFFYEFIVFYIMLIVFKIIFNVLNNIVICLYVVIVFHISIIVFGIICMRLIVAKNVLQYQVSILQWFLSYKICCRFIVFYCILIVYLYHFHSDCIVYYSDWCYFMALYSILQYSYSMCIVFIQIVHSICAVDIVFQFYCVLYQYCSSV